MAVRTVSSRLVLAACVASLFAGCKPKPKKPGEEAFDAATRSITTSDGGVAYGNTEACTQRAQLLSEVMERMAKVGFSDREGNAVASLTGEKFLVHCEHSTHGIAFLIQVPKLKEYKDDLRTDLAKLAWMSSSLVTQDQAVMKDLELGVGLRGEAFYGAVMFGKHGSDPGAEIGTMVSTEPLFVFFDAADAPETPIPEQYVKTAREIVENAEKTK